MDELTKRNEISEMIRLSISDSSTCLDDIKNYEDYFQQIYLKNKTFNKLSESDREILNEIKQELLSFRKRTLIKTIFSNIDGIMYATKQLLLEDKDEVIDTSELIKLQEKKIKRSSEGKLKEIPIFPNFIENIRLTFKYYHKLRSPDYDFDKFNSELDKYKTAKEIRNKITHPKNSTDLNITDEELENSKKFDTWFYKEYRKLVELSIK